MSRERSVAPRPPNRHAVEEEYDLTIPPTGRQCCNHVTEMDFADGRRDAASHIPIWQRPSLFRCPWRYATAKNSSTFSMVSMMLRVSSSGMTRLSVWPAAMQRATSSASWRSPRPSWVNS